MGKGEMIGVEREWVEKEKRVYGVWGGGVESRGF